MKNYSIPGSDNQLFVSHNSDYSNLKIYSKGQLIGKVDTPAELRSGVTINDSDLGNIELFLLRDLSVSVNGIPCSTIVTEANISEIKSLSGIFWALAILATLGTFILFMAYRPYLDYTPVRIELIISVLFTAIYYVAGYYVSQGKYWAYLTGTITFTLSTVLTLLALGIVEIGAATIIGLCVRIAILILLYFNLKKAGKYLRPAGSKEDAQVLDSF